MCFTLHVLPSENKCHFSNVNAPVYILWMNTAEFRVLPSSTAYLVHLTKSLRPCEKVTSTLEKFGKGPGHTYKLPRMCSVLCDNYVRDHMLASYCWWWYYRVDEQILLWSNYRQILWGNSSSLANVNTLQVSEIRNLQKVSFPFSNGLGTSLLPSHV